jgi:hypothetical protein
LTQKLVSVDEPERVEAPSIVDDTLLEPLTFYGDDEGRKFTSYSQFKQHCAKRGYAIKEKGMFPDKPWTPPQPDEKELRDTVEKAFYDIKENRVPVSEEQREKWKEENRQAEAYKRRNWHLK